MSYEGHIQLLCTKGHPGGLPISYDMYGEGEEMGEWRCKSRVDNMLCDESIGWSNIVDDTNCESHGHHEMIELTPQETRTCDLGHTHVWTEATYKPSERPFWFDQELGWMEIHAIKCPKCGEDAHNSICKDDPSKAILDCCTCHNRRAEEERASRA
jgi:hypothetical protein